MRGLRECVWHSVCHTLSIDVFRVRSFPARIVTVAYAFLVLILTHTYTANLAAFLTVTTLDHSIRSIGDLKGRAVATVPTYADRISQNLLLSPSTVDGVLSPPRPALSATGCFQAEPPSGHARLSCVCSYCVLRAVCCVMCKRRPAVHAQCEAKWRL